MILQNYDLLLFIIIIIIIILTFLCTCDII